MLGAKLPRPSSFSKATKRHGSRRATKCHVAFGQRLGACCGALSLMFLLLLMSAGFPWSPDASISADYDLGTDDGPGRMHLQQGGRAALEREAQDEEEGRVALGSTSPSSLSAYAGMVGGDLVVPRSLDDLGLGIPLRIFVYELPPSFNSDFLTDARCAHHLFAAEVAIHRALLQSPVRTQTAEEADFFFVPVYTACDFNTENGFPNLLQAPSLLHAAIERVAAEHPFWNKTNGQDHVLVASHDFGACFHAMERAAVQAGVPAFLQHSIILQTFGQTGPHPCQDVEHIQIPPYVSPSIALANWQPVEKQDRAIFAYMSGKIEVHPKESVSGELYGRGVRTGIWKRFKGDKRFLIRRKRPKAYYEEMLHSLFCLCPRGWAPWSPRIVESVLFGCIPVIIADDIRLPLDDVLDWPAMGVVLQEDQVPNLASILESLSEESVAAMQQALWRPEVRRTLMFLQPSVQGDATWHVLKALARTKLERVRATP